MGWPFRHCSADDGDHLIMRVAVTGASGFLGRHTVRALVARGAEVIAISRHPDEPIATSVVPLALDIGASANNLFKHIGSPDALLHMAWGGLPHYAAARHLDEDLPKQLMFLRSCIDSGLQQLVVIGTCLEYGMHSGELDEMVEPEPTTAYARAKHELHRELVAMRSIRGFGLSWLRLFYLYGPGQASTSLYTQLRTAVDAGAAAFDMSAGDQIRDFLPIEIAADHIARITLGHADAGTVNICSGTPVTVIEAVQQWLHKWQVEISLNRGVYSYPDYEPFAFWGSTRRLNTLLGTT